MLLRFFRLGGDGQGGCELGRMCLYEPTSLTWRAAKNPSPDLLPLLDILSVLAQVVQWWGPQMANFRLTLPYPMSTSTEELSVMARHFLKAP